jgi:hypothetical protein
MKFSAVGRVRRLDHEHFLAPHVLFDLDLHLAIGETPDQRLAGANTQLTTHSLRQRPVRVAGENQEPVGIHVLYPVAGAANSNPRPRMAAS